MSDDTFFQFDPEILDALPNDELDALPFGVIALAGEAGRIVRYNLAEARFARLDRNAVLGRSFFEEVARCTATPEFRGRYDDISARGFAGNVRFEYVFAFRFGAQKVEVDMGRVQRDTPEPLTYLCVNRRKFLPRQREVPTGIEAPLIAELEPEASRAGVARDARARRQLELDATFLDAFLPGMVAGAAPGALRAIGKRWGRYAVVDLETEAIEVHARTLREQSMIEAMQAVSNFVGRQRLGHLSFDFDDAVRGFFSFSVERNVFAEVVSHPGCELLEGLLGELFSHLAGQSLAVRETSCRAAGASECSFLCVSSARTNALTRSLDGRNHTPREIADRMSSETNDE